MNEPLASAAGNAVEVQNAVDYLTGEKRDARLHAVTIALGGELLALGGLAENPAAGRAAMERALASGAAAERFERMVAMLGGPRDFLGKAAKLLPAAPVVVAVAPPRNGFVEAIDARAMGMAVVAMGGGRTPCRRCDRSGCRFHAPCRAWRASLVGRAAGACSCARRFPSGGSRRTGSPPPIASATSRLRDAIR